MRGPLPLLALCLALLLPLAGAQSTGMLVSSPATSGLGGFWTRPGLSARICRSVLQQCINSKY